MSTQPKLHDPSWAEEEFARVALKDVRLNRRCQVLAGTLEQQPMYRSISLRGLAGYQGGLSVHGQSKVRPLSL